MKRAALALLLLALPSLLLAQPAPDRIDAVLDLVEAEFMQTLERESLEERAMRALLEDLDPYSTYMNAEEWAIYTEGFGGSYGGIGVTLAIDPELKLPRVGQLMIGSGAADAGMRRGDWIAAIDGRPLEGVSIDDVLPILRGAPGSRVDLELRREGVTEPFAAKVTRRSIPTPSVRGIRRHRDGAPEFQLDRKRGIGYIRILLLADDTLAAVEGALRTLEQHEMKGLILDLRGCSGGQMRTAAAIADLFLDRGTLVGMTHRKGAEVVEATPGVATDVPLILLIDGETASSAEILAGALIDHRRARALGQRTFGKGRIQRQLPLPDGLGGIVLSTGTFQRPSGRTFDRHDAEHAREAGIAPDEEIALEAKELDALREEMSRLDGPYILTAEEQRISVPDRVLARALEVLATARGEH